MPVKSKDSGNARPTSTRHTGPAKEQIEGLLEQGKEWERLSADPNYPYFANKRGFPVGSNVGMPENSADPQYPDISQEVAEAERATSQDTEQMDVDDSAQEQTNNPHYGEYAEEDQVMEEQHQGADDDYGDDPDDDLDHGHGHDHGNGHHGPNFRLGTAPGPRNPPDLVHATPFAGPYQSRLTKLSKGLDSKLVQRLSHVNCSYLSTPGVIPSLEQLKQHVQSLTVLIAHLSTSTKGGYIDNKNIVIPDGNGGNMPIPAFETGETYDWLNDLSAPYCNAEVHHRLPLTSIINRIEGTGRGREIRDICPLYKSDLSEPNTPSLPYATHASLIAHANEVLELLDHEYSAKGGLLAILPLAEEKEERRLAESTLLGQLILWCQRLVQRVHDLERLYANATDVLAGEALTPAQTLNKLGIDGRQAREMVYPQDRFVLTNAGEDVWQFLSRELDKQDRIADELRLNALNNQTSTDAQRGGPKNPNTGISAVDITTRYFRVRNSTNSLKTIFVVPAWQGHPGVKVTRDMETKPTVVAVAHPTWPIRASTWEMQNRDLLKYAKQAKRDEEKRSHDDENHKDTVALMQLQLDLALARAQQQEQDVQNFVETNQIGPIYTELDQERKRVKKFEDRKAAFEKEQADFAAEVRARRLEWQQKIENQDKEQVKIVAELKQKESEIDAYVAAAKARKDELEAEYKNRDEQMKQTWGRACDVANKPADETQNSHAKLVGGQKAAEIRSLVEEAIDSNTSQPTSQPTIRINTDREKHILQAVKDVMVRRGETSDGQILIMQDRAEFSDLVLKEVSENFGITYNTTDQNQPHNHEQHSNGKSDNWTDQTWASHPANIPTYANLPPQVTQPEFYNSSNRNAFSGASRLPRSPPKKASAGSSTSPQITTPPQNVAASVGIPNISGYKITPVPGYIPGSGGPQFTATPVDHVVPTHADDGLTAEQRLQKEKEAVEYYRRTRSS